MSAATVFFYCGLILASGASLKEDIFAAKDLASSVAPLAVAEAERIYGKGIPMEGVRRETRRLAQLVHASLGSVGYSSLSGPIRKVYHLGKHVDMSSSTQVLAHMPHLATLPATPNSIALTNLSCLPLMPPGTHTSVSYTAPDNPSAKAKADVIYGRIQDAGMSGFALGLTWKDLEPSKGNLNVSELAYVMHILGSIGYHSIVNIGAIDTDTVAVPADLGDPSNPDRLRPGLAWNGTEVVQRYSMLLAQAVPMIIANGGAHFGVGNEVDATLEQLPPQSAIEYALFAYIARYIARNMTGGQDTSLLSVGVTLTFGGLSSQRVRSSEWFQYLSLEELTDAIPVTYYPLQGNFSVEDPSVVVAANLAQLSILLPGSRCIVMQEIGFPAGYPAGHDPPSTDQSSQQLQADFFRIGFESLAHPVVNQTGRVRFAGVDWLVDIPPSVCAQLEKYYRVQIPAFVEYLCTLGVVDIDGNAKAGLQAVLDGIHSTEHRT